jgi:Flp pilus assembly protein TadB
MKNRNPKRGKQSAAVNFFLLSAVIVGLSVYFTVTGKWQPALVAVIALLLPMAGFYLWLWRKYF